MKQAASVKKEPVSLSAAMRAFLVASFALTSASFVYTILARALGGRFPSTYPYYYSPGNIGSDFIEFRSRMLTYGTPEFFSNEKSYFMYPAPIAQILRFFFRLPHPQTCFFITLVLLGGMMTCAFALVLRRRGLPWKETALFTAGTLITAYPYLFILQRWNVEIFVWVPSMLGVWFFCTKRYAAAAVCFGVATSLKLYPFMFFGLFLPRRRYKEMALGVVTAVAVTVFSLWLLGPTIGRAFAWDSAQLQAFATKFSGGLIALGYDHSFFALLKFVLRPFRSEFQSLSRPYTMTAALISLVLYFTRMWRLPLANQVLAISVLSVCLAPVSYDYTLVSLYGAVLLLCVISLQSEQRGESVRTLTTYLVLFAVVLTPESYVVFHEARYGAQLRCVAMIVILVMSLKDPLPEFEAPTRI